MGSETEMDSSATSTSDFSSDDEDFDFSSDDEDTIEPTY